MNRAMKSAIMIKEGAPGLGGRVATKYMINMKVTKNMMNIRATKNVINRRATKGVGNMQTRVRGGHGRGNKLNAPTTT